MQGASSSIHCSREVSSSKTGRIIFSGGKQIYTFRDFKIGNKINVFGRDLVICGLARIHDSGLKKMKIKLDLFSPRTITARSRKGVAKKRTPEWNGYGTEADSLNSVAICK